MYISYNWLKKYINLETPAEELANILTSIGLESGGVEMVQTIKGGMEGLVTGEIITCGKHENSDNLHVALVNIGQSEKLQIVCGAPNVAAGQKVIVATIGTKLYAGDESFTIKRSKIRGIESFGMICAEDEIGIGKSHDGIIVLPTDTAVGIPAKDYYGITDEYIIEVDITPNRIDAASHFGVARDLAAWYALTNQNVKLIKPSVDEFKVDNENLTIPVVVENPEACLRYSGLTISGVKVTESPKWLQDTLQIIGLRPINNIVDATNYVLHEMGHPLHAFDADKIAGSKVVVKTLPEGTPFVTLEGTERKLSDSDLMICDVEKPMCIGGVFGGFTSGVTEQTTNIFLESAYFNPVSIRKSARRHGLNTDASFRFERGCDPSNTVYVLKRCALLIQEVAGGKISSNIQDVYPTEVKPAEVFLKVNKVNSLIGKKIGKDIIEKILHALEIKILHCDDEGYLLQIPLYRVDVQREVDVIEDILRIYGYNQVEISENLRSTLSYISKPDSHKMQQLISEQLTAQGFNEILNNSLTKSAYYQNLNSLPEDNCVRIMNPLSNDLNVMRQSLLFGGLESIAYNINRKNTDLKLYEFGNSYFFNAETNKEDDALKAYKEEFHLGIWITGQKNVQSWAVPSLPTSVFELKAYVLNILKRLSVDVSKTTTLEGNSDIFSESIHITTVSGRMLASIGIVHPGILKSFDIEQVIFFANIHWNQLMHEIRGNKTSYTDIPKYPEVKRDLAMLLDKNIPFSEIEKIAYQTEKKLLKKVNLFDVYEGKSIDTSKKSYAVSFILQDETKTLTDNQIDSIMQKLLKNFEEKLGASLR